jgi:hypothetical protein
VKVFKCNFGGGVTCEMQTTDEPPAAGQTHILNVVWSGKTTKRMLRPYIGWINSVHKTLADEWGIKMAYCFMIPGAFETWIYEPGKLPKIMRERK